MARSAYVEPSQYQVVFGIVYSEVMSCTFGCLLAPPREYPVALRRQRRKRRRQQYIRQPSRSIAVCESFIEARGKRLNKPSLPELELTWIVHLLKRSGNRPLLDLHSRYSKTCSNVDQSYLYTHYSWNVQVFASVFTPGVKKDFY